MGKLLQSEAGVKEKLFDALQVGRTAPFDSPYNLESDRKEVAAQYEQWIRAKLDEKDPVVCTALLGVKNNSEYFLKNIPASYVEIITLLIAEDVGADLLRRAENSYCYAGIGSRKTPERILQLMSKIAQRLAQLGYTLRSGGAQGADQAFERGHSGKKEIYYAFPYSVKIDHQIFPLVPDESLRLVKILHPAWGRLSAKAQAFLARDNHQVLGADLKSPIDFVVCWTEDGCESHSERSIKTGGTGQAISLADRWGIPVFNLYHPDAIDRLGKLILNSNQ